MHHYFLQFSQIFANLRHLTRKSHLLCMIADTVAIGNSLTTLVAAKFELVATNPLIGSAKLELCTQKEAHAKILVYLSNASRNDYRSILIKK